MGIPIRANARAFARTAPRGPLSSAASGVLDWAPSQVIKTATGRTIVKSVLPRLRVPHPGWIIGMMVAEILYREGMTWATMWLNGLSLHQFCAPLAASGFTGSTGRCLTGQAGLQPMSRLPAQVAGMSPGQYLALMGYTHTTMVGSKRYGSQSVWVVTGTNAPNMAKPRPFWSPYVRHSTAMISYGASLSRPGFVPFDVRPWPVWSQGHAPSAPSPTADEPDWVRPAPGYGRWEWVRPHQPPNVITRPTTPPLTRVVPNANTKEVKIGANTPTARFFFALMQAREKVSELDDIVQVMFSALPKNIKRRVGSNEHDRRVAVVEYFGQIDWQAFLRGLIANQIEDEIIGRTYFRARAATRNMVHGDQIGSLGEVATPGFKEYAKSVNELANMLANDMFGPTTREREEEVLQAIWKAERQRRALKRAVEKQQRDLQREANQRRRGY